MVGQAAPVVASAIPPVAVKPRKPVEWTFVVRGKRKLMQVGVFSENKTEDMKWWISSEATIAEKKKRGGGSGTSAADASAEAAKDAPAELAAAEQGGAEPAAVATNVLYLHVKEGESEEVYPLSEEDAAKYQKFADDFKNNRGIHIIREVRGSKVMGLPNKNKYFLSPRRTTEAIMPDAPSPGHNVVAYKLFHAKLETDNRALICHYIHGKGFSPVIITASDEGLVMVQIPLISQFHNVDDAIDPAWKAVKPERSLREKFAEFFATLTSDELDPADFQHPERLYLQNQVVQKRQAGEARVDSSMYLEGGFDDALAAMIEEAAVTVEVEAPKKPAKKAAPKKAPAKKAAAKSDPAAKKAASPKKPR